MIIDAGVCSYITIYAIALIKEEVEQRINDNLDTELLPGGILKHATFYVALCTL